MVPMGQVLQSRKVGGSRSRRRECGAELGGDLLEGVLAFEMRDALHAAAPIVRIPCDRCQGLALGSPGPQSNLSQLGESFSELLGKPR